MPRNRRLRRGIYLLPTMFTVGNLLCGFGCVMLTHAGRLSQAALLIMIAGVLDGLDGRIARLTKTTSEFGVEFDSLADIVSFGVAPAFLIHAWALGPLDRIGWWIAFLYLVCVSMRLARFNIQRMVVDTRFFAGLPSPAAAGALASVVYASPEPVAQHWLSTVSGVAVVAIATLTISRLRYRSFKDLDLHNRRSYLWIFPLAGILVAVATLPELALPGLAATYLLSGPAGYLWGLARRRRGPVVEPAPPEVIDEPSLR